MYDSDKLEELRERAANIGKPIHEILVQDISRRIRKTGAITSTAEYQIYRAEALGMAEKELKAAIAKELDTAEKAIDMLFQDMANETVMFEKNKQLQQLIAGYSSVAKKATADNFKNIWMPAPDGKLYTVKQAYAKIIDFAFFETASGSLDFNTSVRQATKELIKRGVRTIPRDNKGSIRIEYAVRSYITNRMGELHNEISQMNFDKIGANGWEITAHAAPAPDHAAFQGHQYSVEEFDKINNSLERKFGQYGCMHLLFPIKVGISSPAHSDAKLQKYLNDNEKGVNYRGQQMTLYEAKQYRNSMESLISQQKYEVLAAAGDDKWTQEMQIKLGRMRQEYAYFCKDTGQKMRPDRIYVGGFGKSEAARARATTSRFTKTSSGGIIKGRGAGSGSSETGEKIFKQFKSIPPNDNGAIEKLAKAFCTSNTKSTVESMLVVAKNGEVYYISSGHETKIDGDYLASMLGNKMQGSYNIHNHPPDYTQFSFSTDADVPGFFNDGSAVMEAFDYKYRYRFERPPNITLEQWEEARAVTRKNISEVISEKYGDLLDNPDLYADVIIHTTIEETCKKLNIQDCYKRWKHNG